MFTYEELKSATRNFSRDTVVGEGGFGRVFKGWVDRDTYAPSKPGVGMVVAVQKSNPDCCQRLHEWKDGDPIPWDAWLNIATGAAQGLAFLHKTEKQAIYKDFMASYVWLDEDLNAKLSDFGLANLGPANVNSHVSSLKQITSTFGYAAPEYFTTGHLYLKSDVYGFGLVLLELLTGIKMVDLNRPYGAHNLIGWSKPFLAEKSKLKKIMDPRLENKYPPKAAFQAVKLVLKCLELRTKHRPSMEEVLVRLQQIKLHQDVP